MQQNNFVTASELIVRRLQQLGVQHAFGVVGGAIMYITEALRQCEGIKSTFTHHEQGAAIAAEAYAKITNLPALVFATAGPGVTNIITGVADAYMDSIPMIVLVGDVRSTIAADFHKQRYNAPQEVNQAALMRPIVKEYLYLTPEMDEATLIKQVDQVFQIATSGRKGPICISIPLDVQGKSCHGDFLRLPILSEAEKGNPYCEDMRNAFKALLQSERPLILLGAGVRISGTEKAALNLIEQHSIPYVVTIGAVDLQDASNVLSCGCVGPTSQRGANLLFHEADCVLALGTSFDQSVTGFNIADLTENKRVYLINIDPGENLRFNDSRINPIEADLIDFFGAIQTPAFTQTNHVDWLEKVYKVKATLTFETEAHIRSTVVPGYLSAYDITLELSKNLPSDATVVLGISLDAHSVFNSFRVTKGQRILVSRNLGPMGWDVPALLGAAQTTGQHESLTLITGDGSLMLNIQELAVISGMNIPACIFVFNNDGYVSIRTTQANFFGNQFFGCDGESGLLIPQIEPLARGFGFTYSKVTRLMDIKNICMEHQVAGKPRIVECLINPGQLREPRLVTRIQDGKFKTPGLNDMTPSLPQELQDSLHSIFPNVKGQ